MCGCCFFLEKATEHKVAAARVVAMRASAGLLNSGIFGVEVGLVVLELGVEVGLELLEELGGSDITATLPKVPVAEPSLLIT